MSDRYLRIVLTIIALELGWIGLKDRAAPLAAQAGVTPVVIRGIDIDREAQQTGALPVAVTDARTPIVVEASRPLPVEAPRPLPVDVVAPVKVDPAQPVLVRADPPLKVENVGYTPAQRPGE